MSNEFNSNLNILHLCSYFSGVSAVYENLFEKIDGLGVTQKIYVPYRNIKRERQLTFQILIQKFCGVQY